MLVSLFFCQMVVARLCGLLPVVWAKSLQNCEILKTKNGKLAVQLPDAYSGLRTTIRSWTRQGRR